MNKGGQGRGNNNNVFDPFNDEDSIYSNNIFGNEGADNENLNQEDKVNDFINRDFKNQNNGFKKERQITNQNLSESTLWVSHYGNLSLQSQNNLENDDQTLFNEDNMYIIPNKITELANDKIISEHKKKRGRKKKASKESGQHNKYSGDNLIKTIRIKFLKIIREHINERIKEIYNKKKI